jgi:hypothetical protein
VALLLAAGRRAAEQRDERAPLYTEHGEFLPCDLASPSGPNWQATVLWSVCRTLSVPQKDR